MMPVFLKIEDGVDRSLVPTGPAKPGDAGLDLANVGEDVLVRPQGVSCINTGISLKIPDGYFGMIVARSSTLLKKGLLVPTAIIDSGYVGPIFVVVFNPCADGIVAPRTIRKGERVAQVVFTPYVTPSVTVVSDLPTTERGDSGFGSTG